MGNRVCSTPFGIRGIITMTPPRASSATLQVLNAFRHQRDNHTYLNHYQKNINRSAQRLSASEG